MKTPLISLLVITSLGAPLAQAEAPKAMQQTWNCNRGLMQNTVSINSTTVTSWHRVLKYGYELKSTATLAKHESLWAAQHYDPIRRHSWWEKYFFDKSGNFNVRTRKGVFECVPVQRLCR